ncbi:MAG: DUF4276 family protein [Snowella sp.]|nr:DUF4276 family protein [Snowella sp.]
MTRLHIFCEGQTEETFVRDVLAEHFSRLEIWLNSIVIRTSKTGKGGAVSYGKIKRQIEEKCKEDKSAWVTMLVDLYGLPSDFPGIDTTEKDPFKKAQSILSTIQADINQPNFIPNLIVHEFEGLLFSNPQIFSNYFDMPEIDEKLVNIRQAFESPEHINDGQETAPSKRILTLCYDYEKVVHGSLIAIDIGLDQIRKECAFFDKWMKRLEDLAPGN